MDEANNFIKTIIDLPKYKMTRIIRLHKNIHCAKYVII